MSKIAPKDLTLLQWLIEHSAVTRQCKEADLFRLKRLDLSNRNLVRLHEDIGTLQELTYLNLSNNMLRSLPKSFDNLTALISLNLRRNQLSILPQALGSFALRSLNVSGNKIEDLTMLAPCETLRTVDASGNFLHTVAGVFDRAHHLRNINLGSNLLSAFTVLPKSLKALELLTISHNNLVCFPQGLEHCESLTHLDLSNNKITDDLHLLERLELETLDISSNAVTFLHLKGLSELVSLTLDDNKIEKITVDASFAPRLKSLSAQGCMLSDFIALPCKTLEYVSYSDNTISCFPDELDAFAALQELDIDDNKLSELPESFAKLSSLKSLYIAGNPLEKRSKQLLAAMKIEYCDIFVKKDIKVRKAQFNDLKEMARLLAQLFAIESDFEYDYEKHYRALALMYDQDKTHLIVAKYRNKVVGMVTVQELVSTAEGGIVGQLEDLIVDGAFHKMGIGTRLVRTVFDLAHEHSYVRIQLAADKANHKALRFYRQRGFTMTNLSIYHYKGIAS